MVKNIFIIITIVLSSQMLCCGQVLLFGSCADVETMKYFELERFLGKWNVIERFPVWYEEAGNCAYKLIQQCGRRIEFQHAYVKNGVKYTLHVNSSYAPGDEAVFAIEENNIDPVGIPLSIITTDYSNYAIVYGCKVNDILNLKYVVAWILSRSTTLGPELTEKARQELNALPFGSVAYLEKVDQNNCNYHWSAHVHAVYSNDTNNEK
ncbi:insecticyanin-A-like [Nymphalis io]|uniref:insecticyanin-A-like n=1 Tax=Inachis io TaxID=171585 RepID=UPI002168B52A|nr:insecticyanin-A-like [Nymphalis io]